MYSFFWLSKHGMSVAELYRYVTCSANVSASASTHPSTVLGLSIPAPRRSELHDTRLPAERTMLGTSLRIFETSLPDCARSLSAPARYASYVDRPMRNVL